MLSSHVKFALDHPVANPMTEMLADHFWFHQHRIFAGLTVNIGQE